MYSNFWKPIRSWFLITYLNSFKQHCYFSEMEYLQFPPPYLHCILSTLSALWGWSAGLGQWGIGGLEGSKILVTLCPSLGMASGWLPPSMENHFNYYMPFFFNYYMSFSFWILLNCFLFCPSFPSLLPYPPDPGCWLTPRVKAAGREYVEGRKPILLDWSCQCQRTWCSRWHKLILPLGNFHSLFGDHQWKHVCAMR